MLGPMRTPEDPTATQTTSALAQVDTVVDSMRRAGRDVTWTATGTATAFAPGAELAGVRILVLTTFEADEHVLAAPRTGASGFLAKGIEPYELLDAIRLVAARDEPALPQRDEEPHRPLPRTAVGRRAGPRVT